VKNNTLVYCLLFTVYCLLRTVNTKEALKKSIIILMCFSVWLLLLAPSLYSADAFSVDTSSFKYGATGTRDPFMPLVTKDGKIVSGYAATKSIEDIRLEGIVYDSEGGSIAIINGEVLKEDDMIGNIKVIKIESDKVSLLFNQKEYVVNLSE